MKHHLAVAALEQSLKSPSATPSIGRTDREQYIAEKIAELRSHLIEPIPIRAVASEWAQKYVGQSPEVRLFCAIARQGERWLLFNEEERTFALAYGNNEEHQPLSLLGFESDDALAEWLG